MLAPPQRVGFYPNGAFLRCPHVLFLPHFSAYIVSVCTAGRNGLNLSCTKIERPALPLPWAFYRSKIGHCQGKKCAGRLGTLAQPLGVFACCDASALGKKTAPPHNRSQRGQHRISPFWRYTDTTRPAGGSHKPSQEPTRGLTVLGYSIVAP